MHMQARNTLIHINKNKALKRLEEFSATQYLPSIFEALGLIHSKKKKRNWKKKIHFYTNTKEFITCRSPPHEPPKELIRQKEHDPTWKHGNMRSISSKERAHINEHWLYTMIMSSGLRSTQYSSTEGSEVLTEWKCSEAGAHEVAQRVKMPATSLAS